jgi:hypothetical protein
MLTTQHARTVAPLGWKTTACERLGIERCRAIEREHSMFR